jgi:hypothetical protein
MTGNVTLAPGTIDRLKAHAEPLIDTADSVVNKAIDALEALSGKSVSPDHGLRSVNPAAPPNLSYTTVHSVVLDGKSFAPAECYWNHLMLAAIREAKKKLGSKEKVKNLVLCNNVLGKKEDNGYKYLEDVGISVQGQDANGAWKTTYHVLEAIKVPVEVVFSWQDNPKAASPGIRTKFVVQ